MITQCQECNTYFRVSIEQLKAANGKVKCGCCMRVFNAVESLLEQSEQGMESANIELGQQIYRSQQRERAGFHARGGALVNIWSKDREQESDTAIEEDGQPAGFTLPAIGLENDTSDNDFEPMDLDDDGLPIIPQSSIYDSPKASLQNTSPLWVSLILIMLSLLFYQYFYFNKSQLPAEVATSTTSKIELLSRDVREHPQISDVLLINMTLVNKDREIQSFPNLQLDLFDLSGRPVGSRRFKPKEYLDKSVGSEAGMKPEKPIHVVLEIVGSGSSASSFEITFSSPPVTKR